MIENPHAQNKSRIEDTRGANTQLVQRCYHQSTRIITPARKLEYTTTNFTPYSTLTRVSILRKAGHVLLFTDQPTHNELTQGANSWKTTRSIQS